MEEREARIIELAKVAHGEYWGYGGDVSQQTVRSIHVCLAWQRYVLSEFGADVFKEYRVGPKGTNEKIDIVDKVTRTAFELKASPNNTHFEFYRDVFKVLMHNRFNPDLPLQRLVFMTPERGCKTVQSLYAQEVAKFAEETGVAIRVLAL